MKRPTAAVGDKSFASDAGTEQTGGPKRHRDVKEEPVGANDAVGAAATPSKNDDAGEVATPVKGEAGLDTVGIVEFFTWKGDALLSQTDKCQMSRINKRAKTWKYKSLVDLGKSPEEALEGAILFGMKASKAKRIQLIQQSRNELFSPAS